MASFGFNEELFKALVSPSTMGNPPASPGGGLTSLGRITAAPPPTSQETARLVATSAADPTQPKGSAGADDRAAGTKGAGAGSDFSAGLPLGVPGGSGGVAGSGGALAAGGAAGSAGASLGSGATAFGTSTGGFFSNMGNVMGVVDLGLSAIGGYLNIKQQEAALQAAQQQRDDLLAQINVVTSPEHFVETFNALLPQFRASTSATLGGSTEGAIATQLSRRGLTGTGIGAALQGAAAGSNEAVAIQEALRATEQTINSELAGLGLNASTFIDESLFQTGLGDLLIATGTGLSSLFSSGSNNSASGGGNQNASQLFPAALSLFS